MSKKKTDMEMREIAERIKEMTKYWNEYGWGDSDDEAETAAKDCHCCDGDCKDCIYWDDDEHCCAFDNKTEEEDEEEEEENEYYEHNECESVDGCCEDCEYWDGYCELDDDYSDDETDICKDSKEHTQTEELSKFIMSAGTVLGGDMGLLIFDKSNKKDMEKIAAIFGEYAKRLS